MKSNLSSRTSTTENRNDSRSHKAGLVGPAAFSWNWFGQPRFDRRPRMSKT